VIGVEVWQLFHPDASAGKRPDAGKKSHPKNKAGKR
jgi:hypothetical protein